MTKNKEPSTIRLHRVLRAPADKIYRAFTEPKAMCKWIAPYGFIAESHHSDVRVGGSYRTSFTNFGSIFTISITIFVTSGAYFL